MKPKKLSDWRKNGFPKRCLCPLFLFGSDLAPLEGEHCDECEDEMKKECREWSHFWDFYPMYVEPETEPCGIDQYEQQ
jgi:hypothetical protein